MKNIWWVLGWHLCLLGLGLFIGSSCRTDQRSKPEQSYQSQSQHKDKHHNHRNHKRRKNGEPFSTFNRHGSRLNQDTSLSTDIPAKVRDVLSYIRADGRAPNGYVGGRTFGNFEHRLPKLDNSGRQIHYQEWDVNPKIKGQNRGTERLITGSDGRAYYTSDHYNSFIEIK